MRVVLTIVGKDKVGITAKVSNALAEMNINIININQNIMHGCAGRRNRRRNPSAERRNFQRNASYIGGCHVIQY